MRLLQSPVSLLLALLSALLPLASSMRILESSSLGVCMTNSSFSATLFQVAFTPDNNTLSFTLNGVSQISGYVLLDFQVLGYGYSVYRKTLNPCDDATLKGLCPMNQGAIPNLPSNAQLPQSTVNQVPSIIYYVPDIDGKVKVWINTTDNQPLACVEAELSNTKTVNQKSVAWTIAVIVGLGLAISAIVSGLGHSNTAAHVAANALALFGYFQAQAFIGMTAVASPPIVRAWTQNFQWSMGIIRVGFLQKLATWYQRATGGTPSTLLSGLQTTSVQVQKRSLDLINALMRRSNSAITNAETMQVTTVKGIVRVGFVAGIERTNIFLTGYIFLIVFILFVTFGVIAFKWLCEILVRTRKLKPEQFHDFRNGWTLVLKGILFRIVLIAFPQMVVLCFWEMTQRDSSAEVVLAVSTIITMIIILGWAALKVWRIARRSISLHKNPAYILFSDPKALNKWGFLYVQFRANMYYFIIPVLFYILVKGLFVAVAQNSGPTQAVAFVILEAAFLITISIIKPYMDNRTNAFNISIAAINLFNVILLLFFSEVFNIPALAIGIMGVLFFFVNVIFAIVILLMVVWSSFRALTSKNPDTRYQPMRDDRGSFIKSQTNLGTTELDALGATARGENGGIPPNTMMNSPYGAAEAKRRDIEDEDESISSSVAVNQMSYRPMTQPDEAYSRSASPYGPPRGGPSPGSYGGDVVNATAPSAGYGPPAGGHYAPRGPAPPQYGGNRQGTASPGPNWQRGVGY